MAKGWDFVLSKFKWQRYKFGRSISLEESHTRFVQMEPGAESKEPTCQSTLASVPRILEAKKRKFSDTSFTVLLLTVQ